MLLLYRTGDLEFANALHAKLMGRGVHSKVTGQILHALPAPTRFKGPDPLSIWIQDDDDLAVARSILRAELGPDIALLPPAPRRFLVGLLSAVVGGAVAFVLLIAFLR